MRLKIIKKSSPWKKIASTVLNAELRENSEDLLDRSKKNRSKMEQNHYLELLVWYICHNQNITYSPWYSWEIAFMVFSLHMIFQGFSLSNFRRFILDLTTTISANKRWRIPKGQSKKDNPEKQETKGTRGEETQNKNTTQYVLDTAIRSQTQIT